MLLSDVLLNSWYPNGSDLVFVLSLWGMCLTFCVLFVNNYVERCYKKGNIVNSFLKLTISSLRHQLGRSSDGLRENPYNTFPHSRDHPFGFAPSWTLQLPVPLEILHGLVYDACYRSCNNDKGFVLKRRAIKKTQKTSNQKVTMTKCTYSSGHLWFFISVRHWKQIYNMQSSTNGNDTNLEMLLL